MTCVQHTAFAEPAAAPAGAILNPMGGGVFPIYEEKVEIPAGPAPRITSLLIKPASAVCNLDCEYCFYLDRAADPYKDMPARRMTDETLERLVDTYLFYSYPRSILAFQGGEPTLAGLNFFEKLVEYEQQYGRDGQEVANALQTNALLLDADWCKLFREYNWLLGVSLDGPQEIHDLYRFNKAGHGTWAKVMESVELLQSEDVEFNILCVVSQANVEKPRELYRFFKSLGVDNLQFIPLAEFDGQGNPLPFTITAEQYGRFLVELVRHLVAGAPQGAHPVLRQRRRGACRPETRLLRDARNLRQLRRGRV